MKKSHRVSEGEKVNERVSEKHHETVRVRDVDESCERQRRVRKRETTSAREEERVRKRELWHHHMRGGDEREGE